MHIPERGLSRESVIKALRAYKERDLSWKSGRVLAYTYDPGDEVSDLAKSAFMMYLTENALDPTAFPSIVRMEREVVRMVANLLRGDDEVVGNFTSGGTESILLAVKTARDYARVHHPEIRDPEIVLPRTAHCAFHKAAAYFGLKPVIVPFDPVTFRVDVAAMRAAITPNTILLVGSAPGYAQGVIDPIEEIGALALEKGLLFHVDACVGGIHLSLMRKMGTPLPAFDFTVPGVTSMSADMHKYGYSPKGASVVLYRNKGIRQHQIFACTQSTIYAFINPTLLSTKSGGPVAAAWAILNHLGESGYSEIVRSEMETTRTLVKGISAIPGLRVLGKPDMCMFSFTSDEFNIFQLQDEMSARNWYLQPQFSTDISPANLHITVTASTAPLVNDLLRDLRDATDAVRKLDPIDPAAVRTQVSEILATLGDGDPKQLTAVAGLDGTNLPERMALINTMLDSLPDPVTESVLVDFVNDLYV